MQIKTGGGYKIQTKRKLKRNENGGYMEIRNREIVNML